MTRRHGLGLRTQTLLALTVAFIASFPLLGVAAVELTQRARAKDRVEAARVTAVALAAALSRATDDPRTQFDDLANSVLGAGGISGLELDRGSIAPWTVGAPGQGTLIEVPAKSRTLRVWVKAPDPDSGAPLANLLFLYVAVTAGAILLLAYVALTYLIVRPVEVLTQASERLAEGRWQVEVPVRGAAEVSRLAVSFNRMARQLRSERDALEDRLAELERTTSELEAAQDQVLRSTRLASVGRLSAGVAHEIGNPLSAILGMIELLRGDGLSPEERAEFLGRMQSETERIHKIIRNLLDFARRQDEEDALESCDLREVVADAVRLVAPQKDLRGVNIERRIPESLPRVVGSADRLTQVVLNLLLNAADAIEGEGTIVICLDEAGDGTVRLTVEDTGPGIDADVLEQLFEPFVTTKPTGQGTGLGLAVTHTIVDRLGGHIEAENLSVGGARFRVTLPVAESDGES